MPAKVSHIFSTKNIGKSEKLTSENNVVSFEQLGPELELNKANAADAEAPFLDLHLFISNIFVSSILYDKHDDFDFDVLKFPVLDGDVPVLPLTGFTFLNLFDLLE